MRFSEQRRGLWGGFQSKVLSFLIIRKKKKESWKKQTFALFLRERRKQTHLSFFRLYMAIHSRVCESIRLKRKQMNQREEWFLSFHHHQQHQKKHFRVLFSFFCNDVVFFLFSALLLKEWTDDGGKARERRGGSG